MKTATQKTKAQNLSFRGKFQAFFVAERILQKHLQISWRDLAANYEDYGYVPTLVVDYDNQPSELNAAIKWTAKVLESREVPFKLTVLGKKPLEDERAYIEVLFDESTLSYPIPFINTAMLWAVKSSAFTGTNNSNNAFVKSTTQLLSIANRYGIPYKKQQVGHSDTKVRLIWNESIVRAFFREFNVV